MKILLSAIIILCIATIYCGVRSYQWQFAGTEQEWVIVNSTSEGGTNRITGFDVVYSSENLPGV